MSCYVLTCSNVFIWVDPQFVITSLSLSLQMPQFEKTTVHMRDPERVEQIICGLLKGGPSKLQVEHKNPDDTLVGFVFVKRHHLVALKLMWGGKSEPGSDKLRLVRGQ